MDSCDNVSLAKREGVCVCGGRQSCVLFVANAKMADRVTADDQFLCFLLPSIRTLSCRSLRHYNFPECPPHVRFCV